MDSAIADMMGSPAGSGIESGEENVTDVVLSPDAAADISTIDFDDMLDVAEGGSDNDELMFLNYLLDDNTNNNNESSPGRAAGGRSQIQQGHMSDCSLSSSSPEPMQSYTPPPALTRRTARQANSQKVLQSIAPAAQLPVTPQASTSKGNNVVLKVVVPKSVSGPKRQVKGKIEPEEDEDMLEKNRKNAIQARINRQKKKAHMEDLESKVSTLAMENEGLKKESKKLAKDKNALEEEVAYLRSVLANQSALSGLLKNIENVQNVRLTTSFSRKRSADLDHDYGERPSAKKSKRSSVPAVSGGICLHVDKNDVSIEFCHHCAKKSKGVDGDEKLPKQPEVMVEEKQAGVQVRLPERSSAIRESSCNMETSGDSQTNDGSGSSKKQTKSKPTTIKWLYLSV